MNKGEARNALVRAVFFNRLSEILDRSFEQQRYRANLTVGTESADPILVDFNVLNVSISSAG